MRTAGWILTALLIGATISVAQQPPAAPPAPPGPRPTTPADPKLDAHLAEWEKKMAQVINFHTHIELKRTDALFKKDTKYTGSVLCMKPKYAILRIDRINADGKKDPLDYEAYICDGKAIYAYNGVQKTVTEIPISQQQQGVDNLMLDFLAGMKAKDIKERFDITLFKTDDNYIYLDIKPRRPADQREFQHLRMALFGPGPRTAAVAYLPAQVYLLKPNGDAELWTLSEQKVDIPNITAEVFKFSKVPDGWKFQQAPAAPGPGVPPGGAVRPNGPR
ncbi:MAG: TIGR03009 domain-containing protein [Gemmataceae bacterium]|nr:TIGR03009 domain-containing protein [Gemmata sp.]MDW8198196.1 TIGR03009 domain-containing protein [Gemmataceae bacterium]